MSDFDVWLTITAILIAAACGARSSYLLFSKSWGASFFVAMLTFSYIVLISKRLMP